MRKLLGARRAGALRYRIRPGMGRVWGGPMNGQGARCLLVAELVQKLAPTAIVETGSYLGTTTEWLAAFQLPVFSCEANPENFGYAQARLAQCENVTLEHADSRAALRTFIEGPLLGATHAPILFYLDAHWDDDLPLEEEVRIVFASCPRAIVLIDDFKVPADPGYAFDDYGPNKSLDTEYLSRAIDERALCLRYPAIPARLETGARRGCCVLSGPSLEPLMTGVNLLATP